MTCVAEVRRGLREAHGKVKVGHAGTLDPFATGLLLVLVGRATRAQRFLMALPKTYRTVARLGWIVRHRRPRRRARRETGRCPPIRSIPTGEQLQRPPAYSAVKVDGERLYEQARRGEPVEGEPRPVTVYRAERLCARRRPRRVRDRVLGGHLHPPAGLGPRRRLLRGARAHGDRRLPARGRRPGAAGAARARRSASCRSWSSPTSEAGACAHGRAFDWRGCRARRGDCG